MELFLSRKMMNWWYHFWNKWTLVAPQGTFTSCLEKLRVRESALLERIWLPRAEENLLADTSRLLEKLQKQQLVVPYSQSTEGMTTANDTPKVERCLGCARNPVSLFLQFGSPNPDRPYRHRYQKKLSKTVFVTKTSSGHMPAATRL